MTRLRSIPVSAVFAVFAVLAAAALLAGCAGSGSIPDPNAKHVEYAERGGYPATLPSLKNGRRIYINRCSGCHDLHKPSAFPPGDWPRIVLDMQSNAELNEVQLVDVTRYLVAISMAARQPPAGAPRPEPEPAPAPDASPPPAAPEAADSTGIAPSPAP